MSKPACKIIGGKPSQDSFYRVKVYAVECGYKSETDTALQYALLRVLFLGGMTQYTGDADYPEACNILDKHYRAKQGKSEQEYESLFEQARQLGWSNEESVRLGALLAHANKLDKTALKTITEGIGKSARIMAAAVERYPAEFVENSGNGVDDYFLLFDLAQLPEEVASGIMRQRKEYTLSWQDTRSLIEQWRIENGASVLSAAGTVLSVDADNGVITIQLRDACRAQQITPGAKARLAYTVK